MKNRFRKNRTKSRLFHVKHHPDHPHYVPFQCAPESPPEAAGLVLRMFRLSERRPREVDAMFRSSFLNLSKRARMRNRFSTQARASDADSFSHKSPRKSPAKLTYAVIFQNSPGPNHSSLLTPHYKNPGPKQNGIRFQPGLIFLYAFTPTDRLPRGPGCPAGGSFPTGTIRRCSPSSAS